MKRFLSVLALLAFPAIAAGQVTFDQVNGVFRAAVTMADLPGGGTRIVLRVQNTQGPGEAQAIVQNPFYITGLLSDGPEYFDEYGAPGSLHGGAVLVGVAAPGAVWSAFRDPNSTAVGFYDEHVWNVLVAGCTQMAGVPDPYGEVIYADVYHGYVQTCGPDAYLEYTLDVPHVVGTPTFSAVPSRYEALATPEPASVGLLGTGLFGIGVFVRRRNTGRRR